MNHTIHITQHRLLKQLLLMAVLLLVQQYGKAAIAPADGAQLNSTQVMFEYDQVYGATGYRVVIQPTGSKAETVVPSNSLAILVKTGLQFGQSYQWHFEAFKNKELLFTSENFTFSIATSYLLDTALFRYKIGVNNKSQRLDNLVFVENLGVAINREGIPVWFLPTDSATKTEMKYRNIEMTRNGTITYLLGDDCYEKSVYGKDLWKAPHDGQVSGDRTDYYHHDFAKLPDGTYVTCGYAYSNQPNILNPSVSCRVRYNTLIQYNAEGRAIWWWNDKDHFSPQTIFSDITPNDIETGGTHMNSFFYDQQNDAFLLSFRNISRIIKIDKKTGNIQYQFGKLFDNDTTVLNSTNCIFSKQHGPVLLPDNNILFYNNNVDAGSKNSVVFPHVVILSQPLNNKQGKVIWDYECVTPQFPKGLRGKEGFASQLPNKNILVCMGGENRTFEVTRDKKIVWECFFEKFDASDNEWTPFTNYRAHCTSSMFPQYFTVAKTTESAIVNPKKIFDELTINNDGTDDDTYKVIITAVRGSIQPQELLVPIKSGTSKNLKIKLQSKNGTANDKLMVAITSQSNTTNTKTLVFQISQ